MLNSTTSCAVVDIRVTAEPTPAQASAWARLWAILLTDQKKTLPPLQQEQGSIVCVTQTRRWTILAS